LIEDKRDGRLPREARRATLDARLDSIVLESFGGTQPLGEMVKRLHVAVRSADPDRRGVTFLVNSSSTAQELSAVTIQIEPSLRHATVRQIIKAIELGSGDAIRSHVEYYAVVFAEGSRAVVNPAAQLHTRWFKVDEKSVGRLVAERIGLEDRAHEPWNPTPADELVFDLRTYLTKVGVRFEGTGRQLFYNDRLGMVMVRATLQDLDLIEEALQKLITPLPQVLIESRFLEISPPAWAALALEWLPHSDKTSATKVDNSFGLPPSKPDVFTGQLDLGVLPTFLEALEQRSDISLLTAPKVTTLSGRQAQIKVVEAWPVVTPPKVLPAPIDSGLPLTPHVELGPILDIVPTVMGDQRTIRLTVSASVKEFVGYDLDATPPASRGLYRHRRLATSATATDGQTLVLYGGEDEWESGNAPSFRSQLRSPRATTFRKSQLVVLVTVRLIDATGQPIDRDPAR